MTRTPVRAAIEASHPSYERLITDALQRSALLSEVAVPGQFVATIVLDYPITWAFGYLERLDSIQRARTMVATQATHPAYLDCLASYHVSSVVASTDEPSLLSGVYAAATAQRTFHWRSGLTYMELRVVRLLLRALETNAVAERLSISPKTVNAHVSNVLCKLGLQSRSQLIAALLTPTLP
jgi:DNA-binding CsgD family transcriptional regulator